MEHIKGEVDNIQSRGIEIKRGPRAGQTGYIYTMDVGDYTIDLGFKKPAYEEGETVELTIDKNQYGKWEIMPSNGAGSYGAKTSTTNNAGGHTRRKESQDAGFPIPTDNYQVAIIRQNALTNAVNSLEYTQLEEIPADEDAFIEMIIRRAYKFYEFSSGQREVKIARQLGQPNIESSDD